jgi:hypothetical protein
MKHLKRIWISFYIITAALVLIAGITFISNIVAAQIVEGWDALGLVVIGIVIPFYTLIGAGIFLLAAIIINIIYAIKKKKNKLKEA